MHEGETVLTDASKRQMRTTDYRKDYKLARTLGQGSFAKVKIGTCHADGTKWAVKIIDRRNLSKDDADALGIEVETMLRVRHPNIVELKEIYDAHEFVMILELCTGGELLDRLSDDGPLSEAQMRPYAWCLIDALAHCHSRGVVHRDVKLDNVLLSVEDPGLARLCDFGLAEPCGDGRPLFGVDGTPGYRAPEMHACAQTGFAGPPCDAFAVGVCLFALAAGGFPWDEAGAHDPCFAFVAAGQAHGHGSCALVTAHYKGEGAACPLSAALQDLIDALLRCDPATRGTLGRALTHPWVAAGSQRSTMDADEELSLGGTYRGLGGDEDDEDEEEDAAPAPIEGLKKIEKRRAVRESKNSSDC